MANRIERPLQPVDDHSGGDVLAIDVLPEKASDHPGTEYTDPARVCARIVARQPPKGFKTFLSAGLVGKSLAGGALSGLSSLAGLIGELLTGWYRELGLPRVCDAIHVSYHVAKPTTWHGRITVEYISRSTTVDTRITRTGWGTGRHGDAARGVRRRSEPARSRKPLRRR